MRRAAVGAWGPDWKLTGSIGGAVSTDFAIAGRFAAAVGAPASPGVQVNANVGQGDFAVSGEFRNPGAVPVAVNYKWVLWRGVQYTCTVPVPEMQD
jgi:hypothetical protein